MLAGPALAVASAAAFAVSELADLLVYQPLRRRRFLRAVLASDTVGAPLDTVVFLALAGFPVCAPDLPARCRHGSLSHRRIRPDSGRPSHDPQLRDLFSR